MVAVLLLLWPFQFVFVAPKNNVSWLAHSHGVEFSAQGQIISGGPAPNFYRHMLEGSGLSLEVSVAPQNTVQTGPARIVSYSKDMMQRNFTLAQDESNLVVRLRTDSKDPNGTNAEMMIDSVFNSLAKQHIVFTYDHVIQRVYINGKLRLEKHAPSDRFDAWDHAYFLVLGNEATGNRPWLGKIFALNIFNRPLDDNEIERRFEHWATELTHSNNANTITSDGLVAGYRFSGKNQNMVTTTNDSDSTLTLEIPEHIRIRGNPLSELAPRDVSSDSGLSKNTTADIVLNIQAFIPLGFLLCGYIRPRFTSPGQLALTSIVFGMLFSLWMELVQFYLPQRDSSLLDVINNTLGTAIGAVIFLAWLHRLKTHRDELLAQLSKTQK